MDKLDILLRINKAIAELENIRKEVMSDFPECLENMTMGQLLKDKASIRLLNVLHCRGYLDMPVNDFLQIDRLVIVNIRTCGKKTLEELSRIIKEKTGIDW